MCRLYARFAQRAPYMSSSRTEMLCAQERWVKRQSEGYQLLIFGSQHSFSMGRVSQNGDWKWWLNLQLSHWPSRVESWHSFCLQFLCSGYREAYELRKCVSIQGKPHRRKFAEKRRQAALRQLPTVITHILMQKNFSQSSIQCRLFDHVIQARQDLEIKVAKP